MRGQTLIPSNVTRTAICVDQYADSDFSGTIINPFMSEALPFRTAFEIIDVMEKFFNNIAFPQAYCETRVFSSRAKSAGQRKAESEVQRYMSDEALGNERGKKATFVIQVQFRQNATWQGTITWTEEKKMQRFRSSLEMIKLMDEALGEDENEEKITWG